MDFSMPYRRRIESRQKKWKRMIKMNKKMCFIENLIFSIFEIENIHFHHKINENHGKS